jgi:hypothetical protein
MSALEQFAAAIETENKEAVQLLIDNAQVDVDAIFPRKFCPPALVFAVERGNTAIVDVLLRGGANLNLVNNVSDSAVHAACALLEDRVGYEMLALLLTFRPRLDLKNKYGYTALHYCMQFNKHDLVALLIDSDSPFTGINVHRPMAGGLTCTHLAALRNCNSALFSLINMGSNVDCISNDGYSPLHMANNYESVILLLAAGANVSAFRREPLAYHVSGTNLAYERLRDGKLSIVHALLAAGASLDSPNMDGSAGRELLSFYGHAVDEKLVEKARKDIAKARLDFVRQRAFTVCLALQSLKLPALQTCEILLFACGPIAPLVPFCQWWQIATTVKHF